MQIDQSDIRDICTDEVFDRGQSYYAEGRIRERRRVDDTITATVEGSALYDVSVSLAASAFDPSCSCPYTGRGECKHVVALLLSVSDSLPPEESEQIDAVLDAVDAAELQAFVREELARDDELLERFFAEFGAQSPKSHEQYRTAVDKLFEEHTDEYPVVVEAIDFSRLTDLGERYRKRGHYQQAAAVYRGLVAGIDDNIELVDAAYDHYATVLRDSLDALVECVTAVSGAEYETFEQFLVERIETGAAVHREQFERALSELQDGRGD